MISSLKSTNKLQKDEKNFEKKSIVIKCNNSKPELVDVNMVRDP